MRASAVSVAREKVPQRNCVTKIWPNVRVDFLVWFASKPLFYWAMTGNPSNCSESSWCCSCDFLALWVLYGSWLLSAWPSDCRCEVEIVFEIAGAKLWTSKGVQFFGDVSGCFSNFAFHFSFRFSRLRTFRGNFVLQRCHPNLLCWPQLFYHVPPFFVTLEQLLNG